jgi:type II secretory pathway pseudopilin PulG
MHHPHRQHRGLTLVEAMMLLVIVSIVAVAAGVGLQAVAKVPAVADSTMAVNAALVSTVEQTRANLLKNWPSGTWGGTNYAFIVNGTSYTPTASIALGTGYSTPLSGNSTLSINNKPYQLTLTLATADPGVGSAKADFIQITAKASPIISGAANNNSPQQMVTYVAQP